MKFNEIVDEKGTTLKTFAEMAQEKAQEAGLVSVFVFVAKDGPNKGIHVLSTMDGSPAHALIEVGRAMLEEPVEQQVITPVSPGKAN